MTSVHSSPLKTFDCCDDLPAKLPNDLPSNNPETVDASHDPPETESDAIRDSASMSLCNENGWDLNSESVDVCETSENDVNCSLSTKLPVDENPHKSPSPELAFIEKTPSIPGFDDHTEIEADTATDSSDFWKLVSGKSEEELVKEAAEENEWLKCIEEEDRKIQEEEKIKKLLQEVAINETVETATNVNEDLGSSSDNDTSVSQPVVLDPRFILDPKKAPEGGIIEPEYRDVMGFMEVPEKPRKPMNVENENELKETDSVSVTDLTTSSNDVENVADVCELTTDEILNSKPKSIEELEEELVEESRKNASKISDAGNSEIVTNETPLSKRDDSLEPITVQENKLDDDIAVVYKIGVRRQSNSSDHLAMKPKTDDMPAEVNAVDKKTEELERLAMLELLAEAKRGAEREREIGPLGWQKSTVPSANKRFLVNTLRNAVLDNRRGPPRGSFSRAPHHRSRSRDRDRGRHRSRSRERRRSRSRDKHRSSSSRKKSRRQSRSRSRSRKRSRDRRRTRSKSRDKRKKERSSSRDRKSRSESKQKTKPETETSSSAKIAESSQQIVKPSKSSWSSDDDEGEEGRETKSIPGADKTQEISDINEGNEKSVHEVSQSKKQSELELNIVSLDSETSLSKSDPNSFTDKPKSPRRESCQNLENNSALSHPDYQTQNSVDKPQSLSNGMDSSSVSASVDAECSMDEKTKKKFDILDSVLREIEENPDEDEHSHSKHKRKRSKSRGRSAERRKKHKKHKHKHKHKKKKLER